ncbi:glycosyl hydrolase family 3 N terminal domain-containing protein [Penicillium maclennaniae]|uniref:glycosyl hydrolase family 3 N terminal domain-containing protein n=1 Tax=Penicillium maclennaniae TaxID=1343394 RepID=UPI00253F978F|nr:glycosyl hydrolase family 3 N terminal domain-containing protein [Penicillium maclennaniae]KAJ5670284.1 glycosyl hydrolase family 3 N terminal domain-containing protein [Penicillium maclennaniae]
MVTGQPGPCVGNVLPIPRLNFTGLCLRNGPQCVQQGDYSSVFVSSVSAAASWDRQLLYDRDRGLAEEHKAKGSHVILGPIGGPLGRSPYDGRTWEGFAADPYLTGVCMEETINGMQDAGVQANAKHFIANEQETQRNPTYAPDANETTYIQDFVSANINDRTLHEIYMWPFANAVRAKVASAMCSYNRVNGSHSCQNSYLLNHLLRGELGFQGYIMSDWRAIHSGVASVESGMDMTMPGGFTLYGELWTEGSYLGKNLTQAVQNGTVEMSRLDDMVVRIMTPYFWLEQDKNYPSVDASVGPLNVDSPPDTWLYDWKFTGESNCDVWANHSAMICQHGAASTVLLKNERNALPLRKPRNIYHCGMVFSQAPLAPAPADSPTYPPPLDAIDARARKDGSLVQSFLNNKLLSTSDLTSPLWIPQQPDVCLMSLKSYSAEGEDRTSLELDWNGNAVVEAVANKCNNTVVITNSGGVNVMPFADHPNVTAILAQHYAGEETGNAIVDVLYGDVNPSAKLPYVIAYNESDYNAPVTTAVQTNGTYDWQSWFDEELEVGYRYFDAQNISVRYEFGFGLSYTTFGLEDLRAKTSALSNLTALPAKRATQPGGNPALWETVFTLEADVRNTGDVAGFAVPQLYVQFPDSTPAGTPPSQLRGFDKVWLEAGQKKTVSFELMRRDVSYWDVVAQDWRVPAGSFTFKAGFSSRDFRATMDATLIKATS